PCRFYERPIVLSTGPSFDNHHSAAPTCVVYARPACFGSSCVRFSDFVRGKTDLCWTHRGTIRQWVVSKLSHHQPHKCFQSCKHTPSHHQRGFGLPQWFVSS